MEEEESDVREPVISTNDSEYDSDDEEFECEKMYQKPNVEMGDSGPALISTKQTDKPRSSDPNVDVVTTYKWLNRFKTTTCHMFVCHNVVEYVRNERFPSEVFQKNYHSQYGDAYELFLKDSKFYITTKLLQLTNAYASLYPKQPVVRHADTKTMALILQLNMPDGDTLFQHIMEAMFCTLFVGVSNTDRVRRRINTPSTKAMCDVINQKYSWKSESRKVKAMYKHELIQENDLQKLFDVLYATDEMPVFNQVDLVHEHYLKDFRQNVIQLKKSVTAYVDCVTNMKLLIKDLATVLYNGENKNLQDLVNIEGSEEEVNKFMILSKQHPNGHVILNLKPRVTSTQKYRLNCFKMDTVHVWVNSMVYSKKNCLDLPALLERHKWGTHFVLSFDYVYNSLLSKLHSEVVKLVVRYILSRHSFENLEKDIDVNPKVKIRFTTLRW